MPVKRKKSSKSAKKGKRVAAKGGPNRPQGQEWVREMVKWGKDLVKRLRVAEQENVKLKAEIAALKSGNPVAMPMMMMAMSSQDPPPKPKDWP
jgi:hypothetical protein